MISIIIPVYNTEKYIADCLDSILQQSYTDFEVILINDGSTDNSLEICNKYSEKSNKITVITQQNSGQNAAIKNGLANVSSEYVCFIDSDDWVEPNMLKRFAETIEKYDPDCVICRTCRDNELEKPSQFAKGKEFYNRRDIEKEIYPSLFCNLVGFQDTSVSNSRIAKLYKVKKLISIIPYMDQSIRHGEDSLQSKPYILLCNSICFLNDVLYHYRRNNMSVSSNYSDYFKEMMIVIDTLKKASQELSDYDFSDQFIAMTLNAGHALYTQTVNSMRLGRELFLQIKTLCGNSCIKSGACPQQRNIYMQLEISAINRKDYRALFFLAIGRKIINRFIL